MDIVAHSKYKVQPDGQAILEWKSAKTQTQQLLYASIVFLNNLYQGLCHGLNAKCLRYRGCTKQLHSRNKDACLKTNRHVI